MVGHAGKKLSELVVLGGQTPSVEEPDEPIVVRDDDNRKTSFLIPLFILSLGIPIVLYLGTLRLSPYRIILVVLFLPLMFLYISGSRCKINSPDIFVLLSIIWGVFALFANHGFGDAIEPSGILLVEMFGSYILAKVYIRNQKNFEFFVKSLFLLIAIILPFTAFESITGREVILDFVRSFSRTFGSANMDPRLGLNRAQGPFEHPILYGFIASSVFALSYYVFGRINTVVGYITSFVGALAVFFSVSMGAFISIIVQFILICWDKTTKTIKNRWIILIVLFITAYVLVDLASNRTPFEVFISYMTFNIGNAYNRVLIWHFGTQEVMDNPLFGIGLTEWRRAWWMSTSMDNFWLYVAVVYGLPSLIFLVGAVLSLFIQLGKLKLREEIAACRKGLMISLAGMMFSMATVHLWNASFCLFMFLLGSGFWMFEEESNSA